MSLTLCLLALQKLQSSNRPARIECARHSPARGSPWRPPPAPDTAGSAAPEVTARNEPPSPRHAPTGAAANAVPRAPPAAAAAAVPSSVRAPAPLPPPAFTNSQMGLPAQRGTDHSGSSGPTSLLRQSYPRVHGIGLCPDNSTPIGEHSTTSLDNLLQCPHIRTVKKFFLVFTETSCASVSAHCFLSCCWAPLRRA